MPKQNWEKEFDKEFEIWFCVEREPNDRKDYRKFIFSQIKKARKKEKEKQEKRYEEAYEEGRFVAREGFHAELPSLLKKANKSC